jgi:hypothetical protein
LPSEEKELTADEQKKVKGGATRAVPPGSELNRAVDMFRQSKRNADHSIPAFRFAENSSFYIKLFAPPS